MRLRTWFAVVVSVILLAAAGTIGVLVNSSALRAADDVHQADATALAVNNGSLSGQMSLLSAQELADFVSAHAFSLSKNSPNDKDLLTAYATKSTTFGYGVMITDISGNTLSSTRTDGLPSATDPGWIPMRTLLAAGKPGFSSIMTVDGNFIEAVAVPITVGGTVTALMIGLDNVATGTLQSYTESLATPDYDTAIVDSTGTAGAASTMSLVGTRVDPEIRAALAKNPSKEVLRYTSGDTKMIAIIAGQLPGGYAYVRTQTQKSFDGAVHSKSQTLNLTLLAMLLIGAGGIALLGYRTLVQRRRADQRFQALFQHAPDLVSVLEADGKIKYSSPSAAAVLGFDTGRMVGASVFDLIHEDDRDYMRDQFRELIKHREAVLRLQCRVRSFEGEYRWFEFTASNQMSNPALGGVVINARDISENRAFQERLAHEAQHDPLTGLPNRRRMQDALGSALRADSVAVLFVDLDGFKPVNDAHGHEAGDELLRQVAHRLSSCVRTEDVLSRVGGDEFVVLMPGALGPADVEATCARIRLEMERPFDIGGQIVHIGASVGVHMAAEADDPDEALRAADHAMYTVKKSGGGRRRHGAGFLSGHQGRHRAEA